MYPVLDRYEPGDQAVLIGYLGTGQQCWVQDGPFSAWLWTGGHDRVGALPLGEDPRDVPLGPLKVEATGQTGYLSLRVSIEFKVPEALGPGQYGVGYTDAGRKGLGDLIAGTFWVGVGAGGIGVASALVVRRRRKSAPRSPNRSTRASHHPV